METSSEPRQAQVLIIKISEIRAFEGQPRKFFDHDKLRALSDGIKQMGQLTPGLVRPLDPPVNGHKYELVEGERRIRACLMADINYFRAEVDTSIKNCDDQFEKSVSANFNREGHPPLECAWAIDRLRKMGRTDVQIGGVMGGKSVSWINQHHSLLKLQPEVLALLDPSLSEEKRLAFTIAAQLVSASPEYQVELAKKITALELGIREASLLIRKTLYSSGERSSRGSYKHFGVLSSFVCKTIENANLHLSLEDEYMKDILRRKKLQTRMKLSESLQQLEVTIAKLRQKVDSSLAEL